jgi:tRNA(Leu) C34 or U34 (ribose-2'-O)-methylase TrmL
MRGYAAIGLHRPKTPANVGSVLRAAGCYDVRLVVASGCRYSRAPTDVGAAYRHIPFIHDVESIFDCIPFDCVPVAVDLLEGAKALPTYRHPERAFYIFGPEDGTLGKAITDRCRDKIMVPTRSCMNLAAAVNVILYDRLAKTFSMHRESDEPITALSLAG